MELHEKAIIKEKAMLQFFYPVHPGLSQRANAGAILFCSSRFRLQSVAVALHCSLTVVSILEGRILASSDVSPENEAASKAPMQ